MPAEFNRSANGILIIFVFQDGLYHQVYVIMLPIYIYYKDGIFLYKTCLFHAFMSRSLRVPIQIVKYVKKWAYYFRHSYSFYPQIRKPNQVERVVQRQLYPNMCNNDMLSPSQYGFRCRLPTETALLIVSDHILTATDRQELTLLCLLDLSKRFDVITYPSSYPNFKPTSIGPTWFSSYLCDHTQSVCSADVRGTRCLSKPLHNPIGIFQGSCLALSSSRYLPMTCPIAPGARVVPRVSKKVSSPQAPRRPGANPRLPSSVLVPGPWYCYSWVQAGSPG